MSEFIFFTIGFLIGTLGGITTMCLVQINRLNNTTHHYEKENVDA